METSNWLASEKIRRINIFLDPDAFTEINLKQLFGYLSKSNREPIRLIVTVETEWKRLPFANTCPSGRSEVPLDPERNDFYKATFQRGRNFGYFQYNPILKTDNHKRVEMEEGTY